MKIRIQGQSIRARLNRTEVAQIGAGRSVQLETVFSPRSKLVCIVQATSDNVAATATFADAVLTICLPQSETARWASSDQVGIDAEVQIEGQDSLRLLVE